VWSFASVFPIPLLLLALNSVKRKLRLTHPKHVRKTAKNDYSIRRVCPSVRTKQLGSHWTDFHEIWYLNSFRKSVGKIQVSLRSAKHNATGRTDWTDPRTAVITSRWNLLKTRNVSNAILQQIRTHISCSTNVFQKILPFSRSRDKTGRGQTGHRWQYDAGCCN